MVATRIGIRNFGGIYALKRVSIEGSSDGQQYDEWMAIDGIKKGDDELQSFEVDMASSYIAAEKQWRFYRLNMLENYGSGSNEFYEFVIFGFEQ